MNKGNDGENSRRSGKSESRRDCDGAVIAAALMQPGLKLTDEQSMLGIAGGRGLAGDDGPAPGDGAALGGVALGGAQNSLDGAEVIARNIADQGADFIREQPAKAKIAYSLLREAGQKAAGKLGRAVLFEYERGAVFLLVVIAAGTGVVHYFSLLAEPYWMALAIPAVLLSCLLFLLRDTLIRRTGLIMALAFVGGMVSAKWETERHATPMLGSAVSTVLTARIISMEQEAQTAGGKPGRWRIVADVLATEKPHLRHAPQRLRLTARDLPALAENGAVLKGAVRLRPHGGPVRAGQYDFAFHGFFRDIGGNGFYLGVPRLVADFDGNIASGLSETLRAMIGGMRAAIAGRIMQALPGEEGAVAAALISGRRAGISEDTNEALRIAGLAHILSISGLHLALAAGIVMVAIRGFAGLFPALSLYYPVKKIAAFLSLLSSAFYLAVSGADVAAQRSFIMLAVMLGAVLLDRQALTMRNLAIAALFSLVIAPHTILGPSFQMSYSATGALIAGFAWWKLHKRHKADLKGKWGRKGKKSIADNKIIKFLGGTAATSLLAGTASGLYAAFHFNNMAPLGLLGNALAMPVISLLIMPFAVAALLLMPLAMEWLPLQVMGKGVELVKYIAHFVADITPDLVPGLMPAPALLLLSGAMLTAMILTSFLRIISLILLAIGGFVFFTAPLPDIIISEDSKLVAVRQQNRLYVNRARPSAFIMDNWQKAYKAEIVPPLKNNLIIQGFICEEGLCSFEFDDGYVLAYAQDRDAAQIACNIGDIIILAYAGEQNCARLRRQNIIETHDAIKKEGEKSAGKTGLANITGIETEPLVITRQQLALKGVAEIYLPQRTAERPFSAARITFATGAPQRPWHLYRLYSRAARNLADK
ncbi:ComEC/Rec2 family competence protein [Pseudochrobactrum sp. HB0163]|uniref:ComEC/Rec2 family competence protein n=1 Tax=Pseudochrobactrum sp. HB0163 TaxID=3450708 RepID=UPI003F6E2F84